MRVVVTGGSGFIGTHVVEALLARGDEPVVLDLVDYPDPDVERVTGDMRDADVVDAALTPGTDAVIHLAASTSVLQSMNDPHGVFTNNVAATELLLERSRRIGIASFVLASTNAVCGDVGDRRINEAIPTRPLTPYGATKAAAEALMSGYSGSYDLTTLALRFTNVYGRGMHVKDSIVARLMRAALSGGTIQVYGSGEQSRDYVYVTDAVAALLLGLAWPSSDVLTIGAGRSVSVNTLVELTGVAIGRPIPVEHIDAKKGEMRAVIVDTARATAAGWTPRYALEEGLAETWEHFVLQQARS
jgi:UDP-glucose 4-epimerase